MGNLSECLPPRREDVIWPSEGHMVLDVREGQLNRATPVYLRMTQVNFTLRRNRDSAFPSLLVQIAVTSSQRGLTE